MAVVSAIILALNLALVGKAAVGAPQPGAPGRPGRPIVASRRLFGVTMFGGR
jgi:hypothetical protein